MGLKSKKIEIDLPQDIIFVMRGMEKPEDVKRKMKMALALLLFQERPYLLEKQRNCQMLAGIDSWGF